MSPTEPRIVPRAAHAISRKRIDPNALKVMYRLHRAGFKGYLCGGGVRDLLLARRPKDFDIATDARPHEVKSLFRNSRIIGRRFKITQVYFKDGTIIQVSTFRATTDFEPASPLTHGGGDGAESAAADAVRDLGGEAPAGGAEADAGGALPASLLIRRDNVYGSPEEDAFRRDLTINGLFYDIGNFSIIDYVGGLADLEARVIRVIGDPDVRFQEDPVRMIRAIRHSARLDFAIDPPTRDSILRHAHRLLECSAARVLDELYRDLRGGAAAPSLKIMLELELMDAILPELARFLRDGPPEEIERTWRSVEVLDATSDYGDAPQPGVLWSILAGPYLWHRLATALASDEPPSDVGGFIEDCFRHLTRALGVGRKDAERVKLLLLTRRRLEQALASGRAPKGLVHRPYFEDAISYFDVVTRAAGGEVPGWLLAGRETGPSSATETTAGELGGAAEAPAEPGPRRRRRRRRRRGRAGEGTLAPPTGSELEALVDTEPIDEAEMIVAARDTEALSAASPDAAPADAGAAEAGAPAKRRRSRRRRGRRAAGSVSAPPANPPSEE
ncbi:MAG: polynucleotide adenylyltransferase PcnB [bacterium]